MTPTASNYELPFDAPMPPSPDLRDCAALLSILDAWVARGWLRRLDRAFARFLYDCEPGTDPQVAVAAALASHQLGHGHVCLDLASTLQNPDEALSLPPEGESALAMRLPSDVLRGLDLPAWRNALADSPLVDVIGEEGGPRRLAPGAGWPTALSAALLGFRAEDRRRAAATPAAAAVRGAGPGSGLDATVRPARRQAGLAKARLRHCRARQHRHRHRGPGTGKTTTVVRLLALLQWSAAGQGRPLRILLAAPTGKAAARLSASIGEQVGRLPVPDPIRAAIPTDVTTLHRLLGSRPDSRHFRYHAGNPLPIDMLVVDEASMVDVEMMANLVDALPDQARLVLLGDKDQLASVEAGAVLGDLCQDAETGHYAEATRQWLEAIGGASLDEAGLQPGDPIRHAMAQQTVMLRHSRRFGAGSGIGQLARAVNDGDAVQARRMLEQSAARQGTDVFEVFAPGGDRLDRLLLNGHASADGEGPRGYARYLEIMRHLRPPAGTPADDPAWGAWAQSVLAAFDEFQLLCALRKGDYGVEGLNARVARALLARGLIEQEQGWYEGRPVLVTRNDYALGR